MVIFSTERMYSNPWQIFWRFSSQKVPIKNNYGIVVTVQICKANAHPRVTPLEMWLTDRPFRNCFKPLFQSEAKREANWYKDDFFSLKELKLISTTEV